MVPSEQSAAYEVGIRQFAKFKRSFILSQILDGAK